MSSKKTVIDFEKASAELTQQEKVKIEFEQLLKNTKKIDPKQKMLWAEIYKNAIDDRTNASILFVSAYQKLDGSAACHISLGPTLVRYLEKTNQANRQLLDLSAQINAVMNANEKIDPDDIFSKIAEEDNDD